MIKLAVFVNSDFNARYKIDGMLSKITANHLSLLVIKMRQNTNGNSTFIHVRAKPTLKLLGKSIVCAMNFTVNEVCYRCIFQGKQC